MIRFVGNPHVYEAPESSCLIAARAIGAHEALTSEFFRDCSCKSGPVDSGAVNRNTPHSPPVCSMFNEIAQNLKFLMFFSSLTIMTSTS